MVVSKRLWGQEGPNTHHLLQPVERHQYLTDGLEDQPMQQGDNNKRTLRHIKRRAFRN